MTNRLINSEKKFSNDFFKIKIGTTNKKNPETIYVELGTYIKPLENMDSYGEYINIFNKKTKKYINTLIDNVKLCDKNFIFISDVADERINKNKKSYLDLQLFIKPFFSQKDNFKNIAPSLYKNLVLKLISYIENELKENNFICSKTKK